MVIEVDKEAAQNIIEKKLGGFEVPKEFLEEANKTLNKEKNKIDLEYLNEDLEEQLNKTEEKSDGGGFYKYWKEVFVFYLLFTSLITLIVSYFRKETLPLLISAIIILASSGAATSSFLGYITGVGVLSKLGITDPDLEGDGLRY